MCQCINEELDLHSPVMTQKINITLYEFFIIRLKQCFKTDDKNISG